MSSTEEPRTIIIQNGAPVVNIPPLVSFNPESVISFLHQYQSAKEMFPSMIMKPYIDGQIVRELSDVYKSTSDEEILAVLQKSITEYDANKAEDCFDILKLQLKWPSGSDPIDRKITEYFLAIRRCMSKVDLDKDESNIKRVTKQAIKKLPTFFDLSIDDYSDLQRLVEVGQRKVLGDSFDEFKKSQKKEKVNSLVLLEKLLRMKAWAIHHDENDLPKIDEVKHTQFKHSTPDIHTSSNSNDQTQDPQTVYVELINAIKSLTKDQGQNSNNFSRGCHFCGDLNHFIKDCPLHSQVQALRRQNGLGDLRSNNRFSAYQNQFRHKNNSNFQNSGRFKQSNGF